MRSHGGPDPAAPGEAWGPPVWKLGWGARGTKRGRCPRPGAALGTDRGHVLGLAASTPRGARAPLPVVENLHGPVLLYPQLPDDHVVHAAGGVGPGVSLAVPVAGASERAVRGPGAPCGPRAVETARLLGTRLSRFSSLRGTAKLSSRTSRPVREHEGDGAGGGSRRGWTEGRLGRHGGGGRGRRTAGRCGCLRLGMAGTSCHRRVWPKRTSLRGVKLPLPGKARASGTGPPPRGDPGSPRCRAGLRGDCPRSSWTPDHQPGWAGGEQRPPLPPPPAGLAPRASEPREGPGLALAESGQRGGGALSRVGRREGGPLGSLTQGVQTLPHLAGVSLCDQQHTRGGGVRLSHF